MFVGFVVFYQRDLTPALVIIMEQLTTLTKYSIRDWSYYRKDIYQLWHSVNFIKSFIEIEEQDIKLVPSP